ncbi:MAG: cadmium-translocating P-type ATPase [Rhodoferax sp.]|nr:cadmium-translocating P-type ATPase [Rhodoferax sp.]NCP54258.1 cadmium-translocating P-type ATPase [Rhodoferax sp.]PIW09859.1 MAG: heavy metal translocating P-type ATPase [Comamonadaceae bacterium CG17_big_fil_post_rev_8_21_14_2_50_60_13]PIY26450.1 MAG: heavy metal translocating P-type ATPase [Comamonadaceae bacterium CG_4_10_14_3_um_filter_60_75]
MPGDGPAAPSLAAMHLLDDESEWSAFSRPVPDGLGRWESNVMIEGMHCAACALTVEDALKGVAGVVSADVSSGSQRARVVWQANQVAPSRWMQAVQDSGYRAVPANDTFSRERRKRESRQALWRLMVAGLCMMQVMMYAYPAYVAEPGDLSAEMERLLRWASWVLTLPVIFFSCGPFFSSAWRDVVHQRISMDLPVALGMLITFVVSTAGTFDPAGIFGREVYFDSLTMFVFFLLTGRWFELRLRDRTAGALEALMNRLPEGVDRQLADGQFERVAIRRLQVGDLVRVLPGQAFPADGVLVRGQTSVDESLLTGESKPVARASGDEVIAGSHNLAAMVIVRVTRLGDETRFAQIVRLMESAATSKPNLARLADRIARPFLMAVLIAAAASCAFWWRTDPENALMVAVAVLVVTCPCALSLATPAAMLSAAGALAQRGVLVRRIDGLEALAGVDTIVFDKTGTLTNDTLVLANTVCRDGYTPQQVLALAAALAQYSLHPASRTLVSAFAKETRAPVWQASDVVETPGQGLGATVANCEAGGQTVTLRLGSAAYCAVERAQTGDSQVFLSDGQGWLATFELQEDVRADALRTVRALKDSGMSVYLLSGDASDAARRVAQQIGITEFKGQCTPQEKLDFLRNLQLSGRKVAVVGDGLNDGPVLAGAHASFAFGRAVPLAQAQADFLVSGQRLADVAWACDLARRTLAVVRQNLWWAAGYNAVAVPLAVAGFMPAWAAGIGMASSSLLVVLNAVRLSKDQTTPRAD